MLLVHQGGGGGGGGGEGGGGSGLWLVHQQIGPGIFVVVTQFPTVYIK